MRDLRLLTIAVSAMVVIDALWNPVVLSYGALFPAAFRSHLLPIASIVDGSASIFKLATMVLFAVWIYFAGANLREADVDDLEFSPASRIWWFFVPVASLFKPFQGMRELWNASLNRWPHDENAAVVTIWWVTYLLTSFAALFVIYSGQVAGTHLTALWVQSLTAMVRAVFAIIILRGVATAQRRFDGSSLSEVFA